MNTPVRVLRVIEYEYPSLEAMIEDRKQWHIQGVYRAGSVLIHSSVVSTIMRKDGEAKPPPFHFTQEGPGLA